MQWSSGQLIALKEILEWLKNPTGRQIFKVFGFAGTGKTTLIKHIHDMYPKAPVMAYTGKAASVLQEKGISNARTIHSSIMKPLYVAFRNVEFINGEIAKIEAQLKTANQADARLLRRIRDSYRDAHEPRFVLNERASIVTDAPFLVLDEVSMVDKELCADLLSFGKPILVFGDPGQLGPVKGDPSILSSGKADVLLREVHRQSLDNPIIRQSMRVREGQDIQPDGEAVTEISDAALVEYDLTDFDQILTYKNDTRRFFNKTLRVGHGLSLFPSGDDREKLICLENRRALGVYNGMAIQLEDVDVDADERNLFATVWREEKYCSEAEEPRGKSFIWKGEFENGEHHQEFS